MSFTLRNYEDVEMNISNLLKQLKNSICTGNIYI